MTATAQAPTMTWWLPLILGILAIIVGLGFLTNPAVTSVAFVFGLGLSITVAPLTATVLAAAGPEHAGIASAINNDVARAAGLYRSKRAPSSAAQKKPWHRPFIARVRRRSPPRSAGGMGDPQASRISPAVTRSQKHTMRP